MDGGMLTVPWERNEVACLAIGDVVTVTEGRGEPDEKEENKRGRGDEAVSHPIITRIRSDRPVNHPFGTGRSISTTNSTSNNISTTDNTTSGDNKSDDNDRSHSATYEGMRGVVGQIGQQHQLDPLLAESWYSLSPSLIAMSKVSIRSCFLKCTPLH